MPNSKIERFCYSGKTIKSSQFFVIMIIEVQLPPAPYLGMEVSTNIESLVLEKVCWNPDKQSFSCRAQPKFFWERAGGFTFDESITSFKEWGWSEAGRHENYEFETEADDQASDGEDQFRREVEALSEHHRIELRRRLDEASFLAGKMVRTQNALTTLEAHQRSRSTTSQRIYHWGFGGVFLLGIATWINPEWITGRMFWTYTLSWAALYILYSEVALPMMALELRSKRSIYEDAVLRWRLTTGINWTTEAHNATKDLVGTEESTAHWRRVEDSVMRIIKNQHGLSQYDY
jgi:hypothetical protein